ncbi:TetR/AcrR family transcriptional regulator [Rhodococcus qingshengii]|uniref:TetR/AcrR family transcriptional regulator n=1 Tax=Rhodococcus qingshengii TaxID=334542 RepID=UPI0010A5C54D|nr:TetR/AcrR family transcriptional regulator [Rhodococcus qingshengii]THJ65550.1 TetR/AcrR family transcriptional regulator [Rhodococcus qingshengii]
MRTAGGLAATASSKVGGWREFEDLSLHPILVAALSEFQQFGYHGTTVRGIASRAGLTVPSLYYHYNNKEGILSALLIIATDDANDRLRLCLTDAGDDPLARFENFITSVVLHYTRRRDLAMLHSESRFLGAEMREQYIEKRELVQQVLEDLLRDGIKKKIFRSDSDSHFTARSILGMLGGILDWYRPQGPLTPEEIAERYLVYATRLVTQTASGKSNR